MVDAEKWLALIENFCPCKTLKVLVGNKIDLQDERNVEISEAQRFVNEHKFDFFFEISAKQGTELQQMLAVLGQAISDRARMMRNELAEEYA